MNKYYWIVKFKYNDQLGHLKFTKCTSIDDALIQFKNCINLNPFRVDEYCKEPGKKWKLINRIKYIPT